MPPPPTAQLVEEIDESDELSEEMADDADDELAILSQICPSEGCCCFFFFRCLTDAASFDGVYADDVFVLVLPSIIFSIGDDDEAEEDIELFNKLGDC